KRKSSRAIPVAFFLKRLIRVGHGRGNRDWRTHGGRTMGVEGGAKVSRCQTCQRCQRCHHPAHLPLFAFGVRACQNRTPRAGRAVVPLVAFRSAKGRPFAERKATVRQTAPPPPGGSACSKPLRILESLRLRAGHGRRDPPSSLPPWVAVTLA